MSKFMVNVADMYAICKNAATPLLSNYNAPFWQEYVNNYARYDKVFYRMFSSFTPFSQEPISYFNTLSDEEKQKITTDFIEDVYNHLLINTKKYTELYRVNVVDDTAYSILDNYNITETVEGSTDTESTTTHGEREDSKSNTNIYGQAQDTKNMSTSYGAQTDTKNDSVSYGEQEESRSDSTIYGAQTDTKSDSTTYGAKSTTKNETVGSRVDSATYTQGQQANASTQQVAPYDDEDFYNKERVTDSVGGRNDSSGFTTGSQTNAETIGEASHTDSLSGSYTKGTHTDTTSGTNTKEAHTDTTTGSYTKGSHTDTVSDTYVKGTHTDTLSESFTKGEQEDASVSSETKSSTLTRRGNIGIKTATEIMAEHDQFWRAYEFYVYIFRQIAHELLLV